MMKLNSLLFTTIALLIYGVSYGQTKYVITKEGDILDSVKYVELKKAQIDKTKELYPNKKLIITIKDNFKEIKRTKDSLIYSYQWHTVIAMPEVKKSNTFDLDEYIDKEFPLSVLETLDNEKISLNDLKGKPTLINFWFTTCLPCIDEMPVLNGIKSQLKDSVNFIAITYEKTEKVQNFLKNHAFTFKHIVNAQKFINSMKLLSFPVNIFLDKNGIVRKIENGIPYTMDNNQELKMGDGKDFLIALRELIQPTLFW